jgi:APA family basic amino acid/polyamine antiporter
VVLRLREPALERPYRAWGYPATPVLFIGLSGWMTVHALFERPVVALAGLGTIAAGVVLYALLGRTALAREREEAQSERSAAVEEQVEQSVVGGR